jgi:ATP-independent RNA helicase DbpA
MSTDGISSLSLSAEQIKNLDSLGYKTLTPVQTECLPVILEGKDLIVQAKTGSGKTAAFGLGLVENINQRFFGVQALVLCPTRELADQVANELRKLARCIPNIKLVVLCGGKLVLDEADRMLDMGFQDEILNIIENTPRNRQTLLFSATYPDTINKMCHSILQNPVTIKVDVEHESHVI